MLISHSCNTQTLHTVYIIKKCLSENLKICKNKKRKVGFGSIHTIYGIKVANLEKMKKILPAALGTAKQGSQYWVQLRGLLMNLRSQDNY